MKKTKSSVRAISLAKKQTGVGGVELLILLVLFGMVLMFFYSITTELIFKSDGEALVKQGENGVPAANQERIMESVIEEYALKDMDEDALQGTFKGEAKNKIVRILFNIHGTLTVTYRFYKGTFFKVISYRAESWLEEKTITVNLSGTYEVVGGVLHYVITERSTDADLDQGKVVRFAQELLRKAAIVREPIAVTADNTISVPYLNDGHVLWMALEKEAP